MPLRMGTQMPSLDGVSEWVNSEPVSAADLVGRPALVHFWSVSCHSCHEMMPMLRDWRERYGAQGLQVVGIHQPRSEADADPETVRRAVTEYELTHPIAVDSACRIVEGWQNKFVPAFYLFDGEGKLRHFQAGDRGQKLVQQAIERVLGRSEA